jgi:putative transposase
VLNEHGIPIAPNTYRAHKKTLVSDADLEDAYLVNAVIDLWRKNKELYGIRKMWRAMRRAGYRIGRDQVGRLMRIAGIQGVRRGDHRTSPRPAPRARLGILTCSSGAGTRPRSPTCGG